MTTSRGQSFREDVGSARPVPHTCQSSAKLLANIARKHLLQMIGITEEIGGRDDGPSRDLVGDILRRDIAHLEIAALHRDELGPLLEQGAAIIGLESKALSL